MAKKGKRYIHNPEVREALKGYAIQLRDTQAWANHARKWGRAADAMCFRMQAEAAAWAWVMGQGAQVQEVEMTVRRIGQ